MIKVYIYLVLFQIFVLGNFALKAQEFSEFEMNKIKENSKNVVNQYTRFSNLIGDIGESEEDRFLYTKSLLAIFNSDKVQVYNDLDPERKTGDFFDIKTYCDYIGLWYTATGLKTEINKDSIQFGRIIQQKGNLYYIKVKANKTLSGVYLSRLPNQSSQVLEFQISFNKTILQFSKFQIVRIMLPITVLPDSAGEITGKTKILKGAAVKYTVPEIVNADYYEWQLPSGVKGASTSNSIMVDYTNESESGFISVRGVNDVGFGIESKLEVTVEEPLPVEAGAIQGKTKVKTTDKGILYVVPEIDFAESYEWTLPNGYIGNSTTNTIKITISEDADNGTISVRGKNKSGVGKQSSLNINVEKPLPLESGQIIGSQSVDAGDKGEKYSINTIQNAFSYEWSVSDGATGYSQTNNIQLDFADKVGEVQVIVRGKNRFGYGKESSITITVNKRKRVEFEIFGGGTQPTINLSISTEIHTNNK